MVSSLSDTIEQANKIFGIVQLVLGLFGLIALIVSAIGMFNTMTITLLERINEIGIMRSIGVTKRDIRYLFLFESMVIGFLGGLSGVIIGFLGGELVNLFFNLLAKNFGGQTFDLFVSPSWFIIFIMVFSTLIGLVTGIYPSKQAASLNPLEALRYK
ncbi:ABC transporter permease [Candidatus Parcubacteria bacterium]|nr:ABC transporter permease [Candidatus Parcubacteria bacterium]MBT7228034.1 ABC transporter permease [Candidatus Parcubacteria bacterium]